MSSRSFNVSVSVEQWPLKVPFIISRGTKTEAEVVVVKVRDDQNEGRGEAVPYARYGESVAGVVDTLKSIASSITSREDLAKMLPAGAARNAFDCALWDLEAKQKNIRAYHLTGLATPNDQVADLQPLQTAFTLSLDTPDNMAAAARQVPQQKCLKLKLGGDGDDARMSAVRAARPDAELLGDANEAWTPETLSPLLDAAADAKFAVIEQPLPANADAALDDVPHVVPICADESAHIVDDLKDLQGRYDAVNIKLDKAGGLTAALTMLHEAERLGFDVMVGCMVATSLAMAPAFMLAQKARWVDLDGPLLLANDRPHGLQISNGVIAPPTAKLWG